MYCSNCGTPITGSLSFCNRCGNSLKEHHESKNTGAITAFVTAITIIAIAGLGIMMGGSLVLRKEAGLPFELIGFFMLLIFLVVGVTEVALLKNVSKLIGTSERKNLQIPSHEPPPALRSAPANYGEPIGSVTDNTTRTLEYAHRERQG